jgi:hypothetical protein
MITQMKTEKIISEIHVSAAIGNQNEIKTAEALLLPFVLTK